MNGFIFEGLTFNDQFFYFLGGSLQESAGRGRQGGVALHQNLLESPQGTGLRLHRQPGPLVEHGTRISAGGGVGGGRGQHD